MQKLKLKSNHKTIVTACLLALYAFIATPVTFWHHHKSNCDRKDAGQHEQGVKESDKAVDANCKICSHHYSVAVNDAVTAYFSPLTFFNTVSDFYILKKIANPGYGQSNKGPPVIA